MPFPSEISLESWVVWSFFGQKYLMTFVILKLFKNLFVSPSSSVIRLSFPSCQSCIIFPVFNSFCEMQLSSISFGLFNRRTIKCLSREKSDTSVLKYLIKNKWAFFKTKTVTSDIFAFHSSVWEVQQLRMRRSSQIRPPTVEAHKYYLFSALSSEASKFFLILYHCGS